uniref:Uncharacterized protein n=1 Tax=Rhizophagus irregularis (strain DAOM 181602 / DAOM 197198 / MUCL 43194) TaxID=747089 RepID=U9TJU9_RHIID
MYQMKKYRKREKPFDIKVGETKTSDEWSSVEDRFPEDEDYLVQLALKLFSVTPHAGCSWLRTGLVKSWLDIHLLSCKCEKELPHYSVEKSAEEIYQIFVTLI